MQAKPNEALIDQLTSMARSRMGEIEKEMEGLVRERAAVETSVARLTEEASHLKALLATYGVGEVSTPAFSVVRSGPSLADEVFEILRSVGKPMHYREIEREMRARGSYTGGGKDPANALLANYFNDPRLFRPARGTYAVKTTASGKSVGAKAIRKTGNRHGN